MPHNLRKWLLPPSSGKAGTKEHGRPEPITSQPLQLAKFGNWAGSKQQCSPSENRTDSTRGPGVHRCTESGFPLRWDQSSSPTSLTWWPLSGTCVCVEPMLCLILPATQSPGSWLELGSGWMEGSRSPLAPTTQDLARAAVSGWAMSIVTRAGQLLGGKREGLPESRM